MLSRRRRARAEPAAAAAAGAAAAAPCEDTPRARPPPSGIVPAACVLRRCAPLRRPLAPNKELRFFVHPLLLRVEDRDMTAWLVVRQRSPAQSDKPANATAACCQATLAPAFHQH
jgi:hypothetical protein